MKLEPIVKKIPKPKTIKKTAKKIESVKFGNRFLGWVARNAGIPGYSTMSIEMLRLKVGLYFIKLSGLIDSSMFDNLNL